jgi:uncharacterized protein YegJ (DUF2314 family)
MDVELINAQQMHLKNPKTFEVPSEEDLDKIKQHDTVKVSVGEERFWVEIIRIENDELIGIVVNQLICTDVHGLCFGDTITLHKYNVYSISSNNPNQLNLF